MVSVLHVNLISCRVYFMPINMSNSSYFFCAVARMISRSVLKHFLRYLPRTSHLSVFHILVTIVLDHERCIEWYIFTHLYVVSDVIKFSDMLQYVSKGVFSVMLTPHKLL